MSKLITVGGRGGVVALKAYLALLWLRPTAPEVSPRKLATLIGVADPAKNGARRVSDALRTLAEHRLITAEHRRGGPPRVALLREDGRGGRYFAPRGDDEDYYFQIPTEMWTTGQLQRLSAAGLGMLLAVMSEQRSPGADQWWSTTSFSGRIGLSPATRARGTKELQEAGLLLVTRSRTARSGTLHADQLRNIYRLTGTAVGVAANGQGAAAGGSGSIPPSDTADSSLTTAEAKSRLKELLQSLDEQRSASSPEPTI